MKHLLSGCGQPTTDPIQMPSVAELQRSMSAGHSFVLQRIEELIGQTAPYSSFRHTGPSHIADPPAVTPPSNAKSHQRSRALVTSSAPRQSTRGCLIKQTSC